MDTVQGFSFETVCEAYRLTLDNSPLVTTCVNAATKRFMSVLNFDDLGTSFQSKMLGILREHLMTTSQRDASTLCAGNHTAEEMKRVITNLTFALCEAEKEESFADNPLYKTHLVFTLYTIAGNLSLGETFSSDWSDRLQALKQTRLSPDQKELEEKRQNALWHIFLSGVPASA